MSFKTYAILTFWDYGQRRMDNGNEYVCSMHGSPIDDRLIRVRIEVWIISIREDEFYIKWVGSIIDCLMANWWQSVVIFLDAISWFSVFGLKSLMIMISYAGIHNWIRVHWHDVALGVRKKIPNKMCLVLVTSSIQIQSTREFFLVFLTYNRSPP